MGQSMDNKGFESSNFIFGFKGVERNYNSFAIVFIFVIILFFLYYRREIRAFRSLLKFILNSFIIPITRIKCSLII